VFVPYGPAFLDAQARRLWGERLSVSRLASAYIRAVRERSPHGPYRLLGFSFGGLLAYEMAHQLRGAGEEVDALVILDLWLPSAIRRRPGRRIRRMLRDRLLTPASATPTEAADIHQLHVRAIEHYDAPRYDGSALLVRAEDSLHALGGDLRDPTYGWGQHTARLTVCDVPGDHLGVLAPPNAAILADAVRAQLAVR
jgi:thioesterase domain-containing protein